MKLNWIEGREGSRPVFKARGWEIYFCDGLWHVEVPKGDDPSLTPAPFPSLFDAMEYCEVAEEDNERSCAAEDKARFNVWLGCESGELCLDPTEVDLMQKAWLACAADARNRA